MRGIFGYKQAAGDIKGGGVSITGFRERFLRESIRGSEEQQAVGGMVAAFRGSEVERERLG